MRKIVLTYGLIGGVMLGTMMVATIPFVDAIGFDRGAIVGYTTMVIAFLMVYFGVVAYRDQVAGGVISFGKAFVVGLAITMITTMCYVATWEVMYFKFMPDFGEKYGAHLLEQARKAGASDAELAAQEK